MMSIAASLLLVVVALWSLLCVQGAVRLTNSMPTQAKSGFSFKLLKTRVHQKMQNKMQRRLEEGEYKGVSAASTEEEVTFLPSTLLAASVGEQISFGLLDGEEVTGEIGTVTTYSSDRFVWSGTVEGGGSFYLSYATGAIVANVYYPSRGVQYEYRPLDRAEGSYSLRAVPLNVYDEEPEEIRAHDLLGRTGPLRSGVDWAELAETPHLRGVSAQSTDTNGIMDVMVIYTPQAYDYFNNDSPTVQAFIDLAVQMTNDAYANSGISLRMRLVRGAEVQDTSFTETDFNTDLTRLQLTTDGYLDAEHMQRDMYAADAVVLITSDSQYCGLGYVDIGSNDAFAFSLISVYCPQSLAHEVGHNIGAHHDREAARNTDMSKYNFGYCWDTSSNRCSRSVMAYAGCDTPNGQTNCPRDFFFSSPLISNGALGQDTGISTSDNARVHNENVRVCTNWRQSDSCTSSSCGTTSSSPTTQPSRSPSARPSADPTGNFPYRTGTLSNTAKARRNTVAVAQAACPGDEFSFSTCSVTPEDSGLYDTYIRLFLDGSQVARNDDAANTGNNLFSDLCSTIRYTYEEASCGALELRLGCWGKNSCQMTATVDITVASTAEHWKEDSSIGGSSSSGGGSGGTSTRGMIIIGAIVLGAIIAAAALLSACFYGSSAASSSTTAQTASTSPQPAHVQAGGQAPPPPNACPPPSGALVAVTVGYMGVEQQM
ncbi:Metallo-peptidase family M12B Reprolysin-like-domain-containing protein [Ochromonadaceae sp. CCMP2298]|nr:Metallo-peptidase family M12B Reprolysin-like-domain-containing protein [Ochromonadaceae sp. CCMP2298]